MIRSHIRPHIRNHISSHLNKYGGYNDYNFYWDTALGLNDQVSGVPMSVNMSAGRYLDYEYGTPAFGANTPARDANGHLIGGQYSQLCQASENPGAAAWTVFGSTTIVASESDNVGPFLAYKIQSAGTLNDRYWFWRATSTPASGAPTSIQTCVVYYKAGTSGKIRLTFLDATASLASHYLGTIGSATTASSGGTLTLISDQQDTQLNCRVAVFTILWNTPTNSLLIGIGPYSSTAGEDIIVLGADVFDSPYRLPHVPSNGSVVVVPRSDSYNSGGTQYGEFWTYSNCPKLLDGLGGIVTGAEKVTNPTFVGTYVSGVAPGWFKVGTTITLTEESVDGAQAQGISGGDTSNLLDTFPYVSYTAGVAYELRVRAKRLSGSGNAYTRLLSTVVGTSMNVITMTQDNTTTYVYRFVAATTTSSPVRLFTDAGSTFALLNVSVKSTDPVQGEIIVKWRPWFNAAHLSSNVAILSAANGVNFLYYDYAAQAVKITDGTNTASKALVCAKDTTYTIRARYDVTNGLQIAVDGSFGTAETFDGSFNPGTYFSLGYTESDYQQIQSIIIPKVATW